MVARPVAVVVVVVVVVVGIYTALGTEKDPIERETLGGEGYAECRGFGGAGLE